MYINHMVYLQMSQNHEKFLHEYLLFFEAYMNTYLTLQFYTHPIKISHIIKINKKIKLNFFSLF
jgi:hypothetical protein